MAIRCRSLPDGSRIMTFLIPGELGDMPGLTLVHAHPIPRKFRSSQLIAMGHKTISLPNIPGLQEIVELAKDDLQLGGAPVSPSRYRCRGA